jgi:hypothetical protein
MNTFNRMFVALLAIAWCAALAGVLYLIWENRAISIDTENLVLSFDILTSSRAEQILATLVVVAVGLPALGLLMAEFMPHRKRDVHEVKDMREYDRLQQRVDALQQRLDAERHVDRTPTPVVARPERHEMAETPRRRWNFFARSHR